MHSRCGVVIKVQSEGQKIMFSPLFANSETIRSPSALLAISDRSTSVLSHRQGMKWPLMFIGAQGGGQTGRFSFLSKTSDSPTLVH